LWIVARHNKEFLLAYRFMDLEHSERHYDEHVDVSSVQANAASFNNLKSINEPQIQKLLKQFESCLCSVSIPWFFSLVAQTKE